MDGAHEKAALWTSIDLLGQGAAGRKLSASELTACTAVLLHFHEHAEAAVWATELFEQSRGGAGGDPVEAQLVLVQVLRNVMTDQYRGYDEARASRTQQCLTQVCVTDVRRNQPALAKAVTSKLAALLAEAVLLTYPQQMRTIWEVLFALTEGSGASYLHYVLQVIGAVDEEITLRMGATNLADLQRSGEIKDALKVDLVPRLVAFWRLMVAQHGHTHDAEVIGVLRECTKAVASFVEWIDLGWVLQPESLESLLGLLAHPQLKPYAVMVLIGMVEKGMPALARFELFERLNLPGLVLHLAAALADGGPKYAKFVARFLTVAGEAAFSLLDFGGSMTSSPTNPTTGTNPTNPTNPTSLTRFPSSNEPPAGLANSNPSQNTRASSSPHLIDESQRQRLLIRSAELVQAILNIQLHIFSLGYAKAVEEVAPFFVTALKETRKPDRASMFENLLPRLLVLLVQRATMPADGPGRAIVEDELVEFRNYRYDVIKPVYVHLMAVDLTVSLPLLHTLLLEAEAAPAPDALEAGLFLFSLSGDIPTHRSEPARGLLDQGVQRILCGLLAKRLLRHPRTDVVLSFGECLPRFAKLLAGADRTTVLEPMLEDLLGGGGLGHADAQVRLKSCGWLLSVVRHGTLALAPYSRAMVQGTMPWICVAGHCSGAEEPIPFETGQLLLLDMLGLLLGRGAESVPELPALLEIVVGPLVEQFASVLEQLRRPPTPALAEDMERLWMYAERSVAALGSVSRGFSSAAHLVPALWEQCVGMVVELLELGSRHRPALRTKCTFFFHRMVPALKGRIEKHFGRFAALAQSAPDLPAVLDAWRLMDQCVSSGFVVDPAVVASEWPTLLRQVGAVAQGVQPRSKAEEDREKVELLRLALIFVGHAHKNALSDAFWARDAASREELLALVEGALALHPDYLTQKTAVALLGLMAQTLLTREASQACRDWVRGWAVPRVLRTLAYPDLPAMDIHFNELLLAVADVLFELHRFHALFAVDDAPLYASWIRDWNTLLAAFAKFVQAPDDFRRWFKSTWKQILNVI